MIAFGMNKGSVVLVHVNDVDRVFSRFTVHREKVKMIKYLAAVNVFISFCSELYFKVWRVIDKRP